MALIKHGAFWTKEGVGPTIGLAHVEHLKINKIVEKTKMKHQAGWKYIEVHLEY